MKCDLHVHSWHSGQCDTPFLSRIFRESYSDPEVLRELLSRRGMDLVTITDHDSIEGALRIRKYPNVFLSEEVTCRMPSGTTTRWEMGGYGKLTRDLLWIASDCVQEKPWLAAFCLIIFAVPVVVLIHKVREFAFARRWAARIPGEGRRQISFSNVAPATMPGGEG